MFPPTVSTLLELPGAELPCWSLDPEVFFAETPAGVEYAKAICLGCPIRTACLSQALERREPWGVWGSSSTRGSSSPASGRVAVRAISASMSAS